MSGNRTSMLRLLVFGLLLAGSGSASASGVALTSNKLVHGFDSITNGNQVAAYIAGLRLQLSPDRQLVVVSGTHGICPTGEPDKSQGCNEIRFLKEDYQLFHVNDARYVQVVDYHSLPRWAEFLNQHSNDYVVLAWCFSACWKGAPFYKVDYCPRDNTAGAPSKRVACPGPSPGTPQNP